MGCVSVTEEQNTEQTTENVPIIDLNTPKQVLKAPPKIENSDKQQSLDQTPQAKPRIKVQEVQKIPEPVAPIDIWQRLRQGFEITPNKLPHSADLQLQRYLKNPHNLNLLFEHSAPYLFHVTEQLENANLPLELALLPIVESNYDPLAYSPSHAIGLWQFIPATATSLGLERSRWYEGRRDVVHSTAAAVNYLGYLNKQFNGNWLHALAAYNSGEGVVRKAIRKNRRLGKSTEFWFLRLPRETKNYVPQLMALASVVNQAEKLKVVRKRCFLQNTFRRLYR